MCKLFLAIAFFCFLKEIDNLIVPDEVPSLLSLIYSNIPPIKKGTDSRLGWGFRLGDHADFQILLELGPQTNTRPLGNEGEKNNKRNAANNLRNTLYAQNQLLKERQRQRQQDQISNTDGGKWIKNWASQMQPTQYDQPEALPLFAEGEVDASKVIPAELEDLYGKRESKNIQRIASAPKNFSTSEKTVEKNSEKNEEDGKSGGGNKEESKTLLAKLAQSG